MLLITPAAVSVMYRILLGIYSTELRGSPFWLVLFLLSLVTIIGSFVFFFFELRKNIVLAFLPIILNGFLFHAFTTFDFDAPARNSDFRRNLTAREEAVEIIMSGKLRVNKWDRVNLPEEYKHLSQWEDTQGSALVSEHSVFFATSYSESSSFFEDTHYEGFVYTKEKNPSKRDSDYWAFALDENDAFIKMKNHWTWIEKD